MLGKEGCHSNDCPYQNQAMQFLSYSSSCLVQYINTEIDNTVVGWGDTGIHTDNYNHFDNYNHTGSDNDNNNRVTMTFTMILALTLSQSLRHTRIKDQKYDS